jgi:hypothetical protein
MANSKKFKSVEKNAKNLPTGKVEDIQWEGEEIQTQSETKLESDTGSGKAVVLRFFDFGANVESFKHHKPTAQELFNSHMRGIESLLWRDQLTFYKEVEPRLLFSKDKSKYRFIIACLPSTGSALADKPQTLSQLLTK